MQSFHIADTLKNFITYKAIGTSVALPYKYTRAGTAGSGFPLGLGLIVED